MVTPEIIQVFKDILSDLPAVEIHKFASKIRYGIAIYGREPNRYPHKHCVHSIF